MSRNSRVLELVLQRAGKPLGRIRLLKLAYLADLLAWRVLGAPLSEFRYFFHRNGPFDAAFYTALEELDQAGRITQEEITTQDGYECNLTRSTVPGYAPEGFTPGQVHLVDLAVKRYAALPQEELLRQVYATEPMKGANRGQSLSMVTQKDRDRDAAAGISLEDILAARAAFQRGEWISFDEFKGELTGADR